MACPEEIKQLWEIVKTSLKEKRKMSSAAFEMWYGSLVLSDYDPERNELVFDTESDFKYGQLVEHHKAVIEAEFLAETAMRVNVTFRLVGEPSDPDEIRRRIGIEPAEKTPPAPDKQTLAGDGSPSSRYTFDNFIVGASNKFARAVCWQVAQNPFNEYNPLFIYGPSGVGKTHLMHAVVNEMRRRDPNIRVIYTNGEEFTNNMVAHLVTDNMSPNAMASFRDHYRSCDVLVIDDVQFIAGKERTQEEIFHTLHALFDEGKQIILASDRPPKDINPLEERLRSRFEQGLLADIGLPDYELRVAISKRKAEDLKLDIPNDVLLYMAETLRSNIRQIVGYIRTLGAKSMVSGEPITLKMAQDSIRELVSDAEPLEVTLDKIFAAVYKKYDIPREDIVGNRRSKEVAEARHVAIYLVREITELSFPKIGKIFGDRHYSTIMASHEWVQKKIVHEPVFEFDIKTLREEICEK